MTHDGQGIRAYQTGTELPSGLVSPARLIELPLENTLGISLGITPLDQLTGQVCGLAGNQAEITIIRVMPQLVAIERLHMMSQHSNSLATATAAILVHNENLLRLCTKMAAVSMAKRCMQTLYSPQT